MSTKLKIFYLNNKFKSEDGVWFFITETRIKDNGLFHEYIFEQRISIGDNTGLCLRETMKVQFEYNLNKILENHEEKDKLIDFYKKAIQSNNVYFPQMTMGGCYGLYYFFGIKSEDNIEYIRLGYNTDHGHSIKNYYISIYNTEHDISKEDYEILYKIFVENQKKYSLGIMKKLESLL